MTDNATPLRVPCPQCKQLIVYSTDNPHRPFCSDRCKLLDLGAWASGRYAIPTPETPDIELFSELPPDTE